MCRKLNVPDDYLPLIVTGLEHYYAYTRAVNRDESRYQQPADWFKAGTQQKPQPKVASRPTKRAYR